MSFIMPVKIRSLEEGDAKICDGIGFKDHRTVSSAYGYPSE